MATRPPRGSSCCGQNYSSRVDCGAVRVLRYLLLFAAEIIGMGLILWDGVPLFQDLLRLRLNMTLYDGFIWSVAVVLIQYSYWTCLQFDPPFAIALRPFTGHVVLFVSRLQLHIRQRSLFCRCLQIFRRS